jgi:hypothetical protein
VLQVAAAAKRGIPCLSKKNRVTMKKASLFLAILAVLVAGSVASFQVMRTVTDAPRAAAAAVAGLPRQVGGCPPTCARPITARLSKPTPVLLPGAGQLLDRC